MNGFDSTVSSVVSQTVAAGWHAITVGLSSLWVQLIFFGVVFAVAAAIVAIFSRRNKKTAIFPGPSRGNSSHAAMIKGWLPHQ